MKKIAMVLLALALLLTAACAEETHEHDFATWNADAACHWQVCACGEETEHISHEIAADDVVCALCGGDIFRYEDGAATVFLYDEYGNMTLMVDYDAEGVITYHWRVENDYDENGVLIGTRDYVFGVLSVENGYRLYPGSETETYLAESVVWSDDGSFYVTTWDETDLLQSETGYDPDGSVTYAVRYTYEFDDSGFCTRRSMYENELLEQDFYYEPGPDGEGYAVREIFYRNGEISGDYTYERTFEGDMCVLERCFLDGVLESETYFAMDDEWGMYIQREVSYNEDGSIYSEHRYDAEGNEID